MRNCALYWLGRAAGHRSTTIVETDSKLEEINMYRFLEQAEELEHNWYLWTQAGRSPVNIKPEAEDPVALMNSVELSEFLRKHAVKEDVVKTLSLAREHFSVVGDPSCEIVDDPESQEHYLAIHVNVRGVPEAVFAQSEDFFDAFIASVDSSKRRRISLVYHPTQQ